MPDTDKMTDENRVRERWPDAVIEYRPSRSIPFLILDQPPNGQGREVIGQGTSAFAAWRSARRSAEERYASHGQNDGDQPHGGNDEQTLGLARRPGSR